MRVRRSPASAALRVVAGLLLVAGLAACADQQADDPRAAPGTIAAGPATPTPTHTGSGEKVTIAFAGDVHFAGDLAGRLAHPDTAMGPLAETLRGADLAVVNLETAVTTRGTPQAKQFTFRAGPSVFPALQAAGVDVVTMANNHALDYGAPSVPDALGAATKAGLPVIGLGTDDRQAFAPWVTTVKGETIAFLAATAVLDETLVESWSAGPGHPGVAAAVDGHNEAIVRAVTAIRPQVDTVVVELHYGKDLTPCPTPTQQALARDLAAAGADIVVGQHAHILLGGGYLGSAYVDYGMGNFQFYVEKTGPTADTGVLTLTAAGRTVSDPTWTPGRLVKGLPTPLPTAEAAAARTTWEGLRACSGLTTAPSG